MRLGGDVGAAGAAGAAAGGACPNVKVAGAANIWVYSPGACGAEGRGATSGGVEKEFVAPLTGCGDTGGGGGAVGVGMSRGPKTRVNSPTRVGPEFARCRGRGGDGGTGFGAEGA